MTLDSVRMRDSFLYEYGPWQIQHAPGDDSALTSICAAQIGFDELFKKYF